MFASAARGPIRDLFDSMEGAQVIAETEKTDRQSVRAYTIFWPNRQGVRKVCA